MLSDIAKVLLKRPGLGLGLGLVEAAQPYIPLPGSKKSLGKM